jgi:hypothetical protein
MGADRRLGIRRDGLRDDRRDREAGSVPDGPETGVTARGAEGTSAE